ncbi:MAG: hypothetical protein COB30_000230 [Ectothiorhodospiraceae bacterium]|nr:hypothetical protein [Ectothiorhodospiraceae bacterium]
MSTDKGLDYLLDLDGQILAQEDGSWIKIEARLLDEPTKECPHRISYCLTLHDRFGERLLGFDNAHPIKAQKRGRFTGWRSVYDHKHRHPNDKGVPYTFESAEQLLSDFFAEADKILKTKK